MRCLLVVVLASACGSTVLPEGGGVQNPKSLYVAKPDLCNPFRAEVAIHQHPGCGDNTRR